MPVVHDDVRLCPRCGHALAEGCNVCSTCGYVFPNAVEQRADAEGCHTSPEAPQSEDATRVVAHRVPLGAARAQKPARPNNNTNNNAYVDDASCGEERTRVAPRCGSAGTNDTQVPRTAQGTLRANRPGPSVGVPANRGSLKTRIREWGRNASDVLSGKRPLRQPSYGSAEPGRFAMPKAAALVGGVLCILVAFGSWASAATPLGSGTVAGVASLSPIPMASDAWRVICAAFGSAGSAVSSATSSASSGSIDILGSLGTFASGLVFMALALARIAAPIYVLVGLVRASLNPSPYEFATLERSLRVAAGVALTWLVAIGCFERIATLGSTTAASVPGDYVFWILLGFSYGGMAWFSLMVCVASLAVVWGWRRLRSA